MGAVSTPTAKPSRTSGRSDPLLVEVELVASPELLPDAAEVSGTGASVVTSVLPTIVVSAREVLPELASATPADESSPHASAKRTGAIRARERIMLQPLGGLATPRRRARS